MIIRSLILAVVSACLASAPASSPAQEAAKKAPDLAALAEAGVVTIERLEEQASSWTAVSRFTGESEVFIEVTNTPEMRRIVLSVEVDGHRTEAIKIIDRDDAWYVSQNGGSTKYRPFEAPLSLRSAYTHLATAVPHCIVDDLENSGLGEYQETKDGVATYRTPINEATGKMLRRLLADYQVLKHQDPAAGAEPGVVRAMEVARDMVENGLPLKVDLASGMLVRFGASQRGVEIRNFRWLDEVPPETFAVDDRGWDDYSNDPTEGGTDDIVMIANNANWRPGQDQADTEAMLVDLRTGKFRRVPFAGANVMAGCFLKDRAHVVVSGVDVLQGVRGLYEIDLKTGESWRLGGDLLATGLPSSLAVSPDGKTIAVLHKGESQRLLDSQVYLIDVETGEARPLGEPRDQACLSWLPDGQGLLLLSLEPVIADDLKSERKGVICRMDLEGRVEKIREGFDPVLLDDHTVLFRAPVTKAWWTCGLDGRDEKPYADGLTGYRFPTVAPDGKRLIMMRLRPDGSPEPIMFPLGEAAGKPVVSAPGLWTTPIWR